MTAGTANSSGKGRRFRRPSRLAIRLAVASLVIALPPLIAVLVTAVRAVRESNVASTFSGLDGMAEAGLGNPPPDTSPAALADWAMGLAAFESGRAPAGITPTRRERRVTLIARDGTVLADSHEEAAAMDNHAGRPEVAAAFASGYGRSQRFSETRGEELNYVAVRLPWRGDLVLRLSEPVIRLEETIRAILTPVIVVAAVAAIVAATFSFFYAGRFGDRVARLVRFSERVAQGDFTPEPAPLRMDELDALLSSLNRTAQTLETSFRSLTAEKNQGATILSSMVEGVAVFDRDLRIQYLNGAFRAALSLPGESWRDYRGRDARQVLEERRLLKMVKAAMRGKSREREISLRGRDVLARGAPVRSFEASAAPAAAEAESPESVGAVLVLMDVTRLHALERVRRDFVANLSHELKTPLTAIRGFAETLLDSDLGGPPEQKRFLRIIREHAVRLSGLTDDLLRLARIEAGKLEPRPVPVEIPRIIESVVESARLGAGKRALITREANGTPAIETDPTLLTEILQNLVDNAIQYSAEDGRVEIETEIAADEVRIAVRDDGVGIPKRHQSRIFERFYRVDAARSRAVGGTGLGLSIARHLAGLLGGRIRVESATDKGSRFTVALPLAFPEGRSPLGQLESDPGELAGVGSPGWS